MVFFNLPKADDAKAILLFTHHPMCVEPQSREKQSVKHSINDILVDCDLVITLCHDFAFSSINFHSSFWHAFSNSWVKAKNCRGILISQFINIL